MMFNFLKVLSLSVDNPNILNEQGTILKNVCAITFTDYAEVIDIPIINTSILTFSNTVTMTNTIDITSWISIGDCNDTVSTYIETITALNTETETYTFTNTINITENVPGNTVTSTAYYCPEQRTDYRNFVYEFSTSANAVLSSYEKILAMKEVKNQLNCDFNNSFIRDDSTPNYPISYANERIFKSYQFDRNESLFECLNGIVNGWNLLSEFNGRICKLSREFLVFSKSAINYETKSNSDSKSRDLQIINSMQRFVTNSRYTKSSNDSLLYNCIEKLINLYNLSISETKEIVEHKFKRDEALFNFMHIFSCNEDFPQSYSNVNENILNFSTACKHIMEIDQKISILEKSKNEIYVKFLELFKGSNMTVVFPDHIEVQKCIKEYTDFTTQMEYLKVQRITQKLARDLETKKFMQCFISRVHKCPNSCR